MQYSHPVLQPPNSVLATPSNYIYCRDSDSLPPSVVPRSYGIFHFQAFVRSSRHCARIALLVSCCRLSVTARAFFRLALVLPPRRSISSLYRVANVIHHLVVANTVAPPPSCPAVEELYKTDRRCTGRTAAAVGGLWNCILLDQMQYIRTIVTQRQVGSPSDQVKKFRGQPDRERVVGIS